MMITKIINSKKFFWIAALISNFLWASLFSVIKLGYSIAKISSRDVYGQILFAGYVFTVSGIITIGGNCFKSEQCFLKKNTRKELKVKSVMKIIIIALCQTVFQYSFLYIGLAHTTATKGAILSSTNVFISIILSAIVFKQEVIIKEKIIGCILGFSGIVILNITNIYGGWNWSLGDIFVLFAAFFVALAVVLVRHFSQDIDPISLSGWQSFLGGIVLIIIGMVKSKEQYHINCFFVFIILYLAIASAIAYSVWCVLLKNYRVSKVAIFGMTEPIFGIIISSILLKENILHLNYIIALFVICIGIWLVNRNE